MLLVNLCKLESCQNLCAADAAAAPVAAAAAAAAVAAAAAAVAAIAAVAAVAAVAGAAAAQHPRIMISSFWLPSTYSHASLLPGFNCTIAKSDAYAQDDTKRLQTCP